MGVSCLVHGRCTGGSSILSILAAGQRRTWTILCSSAQLPPCGGALQGSPSGRCRDHRAHLLDENRDPHQPPERAMPCSEAIMSGHQQEGRDPRTLILQNSPGGPGWLREGRGATCERDILHWSWQGWGWDHKLDITINVAFFCIPRLLRPGTHLA